MPANAHVNLLKFWLKTLKLLLKGAQAKQINFKVRQVIVN